MVSLQYLAAGLSLWLPLFVDPTRAQNWQIFGTKLQEEQIRPAWKQAIDIAARASDMLATRSNEQKVKDTVGLLLGPNGNVDWAKEHLAGVAKYNREPSQVTESNTDVYVYANADFLEKLEGQGTGVWNKAQKTWVGKVFQEIYIQCNTRTQFGPSMNAFAATTSSDLPKTAEYDTAVKAWYETQDPTTAPVLSDFGTPQPKVPNLMNLCKLALMQNYFHYTIDKGMLEKATDRSVLNLQPIHDGSPANYLVKQLTGTILHELTHTNLGGRANDFPAGKCYGWDCVSYGKTSGHNADTITLLGIGLWMIDEGYYLNNFGGINKI